MFYEIETYHYLIIHFPIALFITGYLFDIIGVLKKEQLYESYGYISLNMGIFFGGLSIISGFITDRQIGHMDSIFPIWTTHGTHMILAILLFLSISIIRNLNSKGKMNISLTLILLFHGLIVLFFMHGTHIGAKLADRI